MAQPLNLDQAFYAVICSYGRKLYFAEREVQDADLDETVKDIVSGQVTGVERVLRFNPVEHSCDDVTADIAIEITNRLDPNEPIRADLRDFIEAHADFAIAPAE